MPAVCERLLVIAAVFVALSVLVLLGAAMVLTGRWDPGLARSDRPGRPELPPGPWRATDVEGLKFRVGLRGYRMEDVDAALAAIAAELRDRPATADDPPTAPARTSAD